MKKTDIKIIKKMKLSVNDKKNSVGTILILLTIILFLSESTFLLFSEINRYYEPITVKMWLWGYQRGPNMVAMISAGQYLCAIYTNGEKVVYFEKLSGQTINEFSVQGAICGAAFNDGKIAILCANPSRIDTYDFNKKVASIPVAGLSIPRKLMIDSENNYYIADTGLAKVLKLNNKGEKIFEINVAAIPGISVWGGASVMDKYNELFIIDNNRFVTVFSEKGALLKRWKAFQMTPNILYEIQAGSDGYLYLLDREGQKIYIYNKKGSYIARFSRSLDVGHFGKLYWPLLLASDDEYLYVQTEYINVYRLYQRK